MAERCPSLAHTLAALTLPFLPSRDIWGAFPSGDICEPFLAGVFEEPLFCDGAIGDTSTLPLARALQEAHELRSPTSKPRTNCQRLSEPGQEIIDHSHESGEQDMGAEHFHILSWPFQSGCLHPWDARGQIQHCW